jgi:hypothetical protein
MRGARFERGGARWGRRVAIRGRGREAGGGGGGMAVDAGVGGGGRWWACGCERSRGERAERSVSACRVGVTG